MIKSFKRRFEVSGLWFGLQVAENSPLGFGDTREETARSRSVSSFLRKAMGFPQTCDEKTRCAKTRKKVRQLYWQVPGANPEGKATRSKPLHGRFRKEKK